MRYFIIGLITLSTLFANAQQKCGQHILENQLRAENPAIDKQIVEYQEWISKAQYQSQSRADKIIIPVVFHVIHQDGPENIADEQILEAVRVMNEDFNAQNEELSEVVSAFSNFIGNGEIEFRLAQLDPNGNPTTGIDRIRSAETFVGDDGSKLNPWPRERYYNIWVTDVISVGNAAAYAYRPASNPSAAIDGVISNHRYVGTIGTAENSDGKTLSHETGHYLGLSHTWGPTNEPGVSDNCNFDDDISDTPNTQGVGNNSCNTSQSTCGSVDNVQNFMDYASCPAMFTNGQINVMRATLNSPVVDRNKLGTSSNLLATGVSDLSRARYYAERQTLCKGETLLLFDESTYEAESWSWKLSSLFKTYTSMDKNPEIVMDYPGVYDLELTVTQGSITKTLVEENAIAVTESIGSEAVPFVEDFSQDIENWIIDEHEVESINRWSFDSQVGFGDNFSIMMNNLNAVNPSEHDLILSSLDFRTISSLSMSFDVAYKQTSSFNDDELQVLISSDCGNNWVKIWSSSGVELAGNSSLVSSPFVPIEADWNEFSLSGIPNVFFNESTLVMFKFVSGGGNHLYLDNINISGSFNSETFLVYPADQATNLGNEVLLDWRHVESAASYALEVDTDNGFSSTNKIAASTTAQGNNSGGSDTRYLLENLTNNQTYFWRVKANNSADWSETWSFTVDQNGVGIGVVDISDWSFYPNPTNNQLTISGLSLEWNNLVLTNLSGQIVLSENIDSSKPFFDLDVSSLHAGIYFITLFGDDFISTKQLVKAD